MSYRSRRLNQGEDEIPETCCNDIINLVRSPSMLQSRRGCFSPSGVIWGEGDAPLDLIIMALLYSATLSGSPDVTVAGLDHALSSPSTDSQSLAATASPSPSGSASDSVSSPSLFCCTPIVRSGAASGNVLPVRPANA